MRFVVFAALSVLTLSLFDARPASAAWQCMGGELACGGSAHASKKKVAKAYQGEPQGRLFEVLEEGR